MHNDLEMGRTIFRHWVKGRVVGTKMKGRLMQMMRALCESDHIHKGMKS